MAQIVRPVSAMSQRADAGALPEKRSLQRVADGVVRGSFPLLNKHWSSVLSPPGSTLQCDGVWSVVSVRRSGHSKATWPRQLGNDELDVDILRVTALFGRCTGSQENKFF
jgi:hypothetical protein